MPKNATEMTAKRKSNCLECYCIISSGSSIKVYDNKWYHNRCWDKVFNRIVKIRDKKRKIKKNLIIYKSSNQSLHNLTNKVIDSLGVISKEIDSIWEEIGREKTTADEYNG